MATPDPNEYRKGAVANSTGKRTDLAMSFDTAADKLIRRAINARGAWTATLVPSPEHERDQLDAGGLTYHERSFIQACYYHRLVYLHGPGGWTDEDGRWHQNPNPHRRYALKRRWRDGLRRQGRFTGRVLEVRVVRVGEASVYAWEHGATS
jgi:hypothetical protein